MAVKNQAPNLIQFEGWVHRFKDMDRYMRQKGYGAHAVAYFKVLCWDLCRTNFYDVNIYLFNCSSNEHTKTNTNVSGLHQIFVDVGIQAGHAGQV